MTLVLSHCETRNLRALRGGGGDSKMDRLLIAGDDSAIEFIATVARVCDYRVRSAQSDADFRTLLRSFTPTVVAIDLTSPSLDGIELLGILGNESFRPAILLITAYDER